jgi:hypothetical protein
VSILPTSSKIILFVASGDLKAEETTKQEREKRKREYGTGGLFHCPFFFSRFYALSKVFSGSRFGSRLINGGRVRTWGGFTHS